METNHRCDFCHKIIPLGRYGSQVREGKAQGLFHGKQCYDAALDTYEKIEREEGISDDMSDDTEEIE